MAAPQPWPTSPFITPRRSQLAVQQPYPIVTDVVVEAQYREPEPMRTSQRPTQGDWLAGHLPSRALNCNMAPPGSNGNYAWGGREGFFSPRGSCNSGCTYAGTNQFATGYPCGVASDTVRMQTGPPHESFALGGTSRAFQGPSNCGSTFSTEMGFNHQQPFAQHPQFHNQHQPSQQPFCHQKSLPTSVNKPLLEGWIDKLCGGVKVSWETKWVQLHPGGVLTTSSTEGGPIEVQCQLSPSSMAVSVSHPRVSAEARARMYGMKYGFEISLNNGEAPWLLNPGMPMKRDIWVRVVNETIASLRGFAANGKGRV
eukprot:TRINITY_DN61715_c0_g1_i1.p1 TRINITY_DN61715_c0_g1~~TRINITY_DN61715_c0_g1_i1.p1  ORF type:complete len:367 (+),score=16.79 TRINITY_DN61715_c0_g1_i1:166-1101(+)